MKTSSFFLFFLIIATGLYAQQPDTSRQTATDSTHFQLADYRQLLQESLQKKQEDSLRKLDLLQQISLLKERDKFKEAALIQQIRDIEQKDSLRNASQNQKILKLKETTMGYPVAPFADTLFMVYLKIGPVLPRERAASISRKIQQLYENNEFRVDSLIFMSNESTVDIVYQELIVMSITDWDALWSEQSKSDLAASYTGLIKASISKERELNSLNNLLSRIGLTVLILVVSWLLVFLFNRLFKKGEVWITERKDRFFKGIKIREYEILQSNHELEAALKIWTGLKWAILAIILYFSLPLVFSIFPFTKGLADTLISWIWDPAKDILLSIWNYLPNLFSIGVIYLVTRYSIRFLRFLSVEVEEGRLTLAGFHPDWSAPTFNILRFLLYAFMFVVIFPYLPGSDSDIFKGVSVFLGILFSLGSSTAIANAVAGMVITYMRPFKIGDRIKIGDVTGDVVEKTLLVTRIKTTKNEYITVPNVSVLTGNTTNYSTAKLGDGLILNTTVTIGYDVSWRTVHELLIDAAKATDGINLEKSPFVLQTSLDDYYVSYQLNAYTHEPERMAAIYSVLHQNIQDGFNARKIEILSPHYRANRDGSDIAIPKED